MTQNHSPACPICNKPAIDAYRPFCSARCKQVDLGKWLNGSYRIESDSATEDETDSPREQD